MYEDDKENIGTTATASKVTEPPALERRQTDTTDNKVIKIEEARAKGLSLLLLHCLCLFLSVLPALSELAFHLLSHPGTVSPCLPFAMQTASVWNLSGQSVQSGLL